MLITDQFVDNFEINFLKKGKFLWLIQEKLLSLQPQWSRRLPATIG